MSDMHFSTTASSTCCGNDTRDADRLGSVEINPLFARPKEARSFPKNRIPDTAACRKPPTRWCMTTPCSTATPA